MNFLNQPIIKTLPIIWNKLYQLVVWIFVKDPNEKINAYKGLTLTIIVSYMTVLIDSIFIKRYNIIFSFISTTIACLLLTFPVPFLIEQFYL